MCVLFLSLLLVPLLLLLKCTESFQPPEMLLRSKNSNKSKKVMKKQHLGLKFQKPSRLCPSEWFVPSCVVYAAHAAAWRVVRTQSDHLAPRVLLMGRELLTCPLTSAVQPSVSLLPPQLRWVMVSAPSQQSERKCFEVPCRLQGASIRLIFPNASCTLWYKEQKLTATLLTHKG